MTEEEKNRIYAMGNTFESFKELNNRRLAEIERKGAADPLTDMALQQLNEKMDRISVETREAKRIAMASAAAPYRSPLGGDMEVSERKEADAFALERKEAFRSGTDVEGYKGYKTAFKNYLRKNNAGSSMDEVKALSVGSDPDGGFAVTPDMSGRIASLVYETSPVRQVANVVTIGTDALEGFNDVTEALSGWVGETEARSETASPQLGEWRIPVHEQYAEPKATQKLLDDAMFDIEGYLAGKIAERLSRMENAAFVNGNGVKKPRGFLTYAAGTPSSSTFNVIQQVLSGGAGAFAAEDPGDALINLVYSLKSHYRERAVFMMNRDTLASVRKLKDDNDNYLWQPDFQQQHAGTLLGFKVVEAEDMPSISSGSLSIAFGDFHSGYQIVDRQGIRILRDSFTAKPYVKFYTTKRVGGDVVNFEAIKLMKFANA